MDATPRNDSAFDVAWNPPINPAGVDVFYTLTSNVHGKTCSADKNEKICTIGGLAACTNYNIEIRACHKNVPTSKQSPSIDTLKSSNGTSLFLQAARQREDQALPDNLFCSVPVDDAVCTLPSGKLYIKLIVQSLYHFRVLSLHSNQ